MRSPRALAAVLLVSLGMAFLLLLARAMFEGAAVGSVSQATLSMLIVVGFLILAGVAVLASNGRVAELAARRCAACGSGTYMTLRALDRRPVVTCFTCGLETLAGA